MKAALVPNGLYCLTLILTGHVLHGQATSTLGGRVFDVATEAPLIGATVQVFASDTSYGTTTDTLGYFRFTDLPTGIHRVRASYVGFIAADIAEVWVRMGKEEMVVVPLHRQVTGLQEVEVLATGPSRMSTMSSIELTVEQSLRYPATFFDPTRLAMSYAGVASTNDQANHFSVRGNGPASNAWLLEGAEIVNPNHLTNAGTATDLPTLSGGGTTILSAQMLGTSRLLKGGLAAPYGNAVGGIMDLRLRPGTNARHAFTGQAGLLGVDLSAEGPFKAGSRSTYLVNYRYSTLGLLSAMGVQLGDEEITFQDLSFHVAFPIGKTTLTLFGMGGNSSNRFTAKDSLDQEYDKDSQNIDYTARVGATGITFKMPFGENAAWATTVVVSENDQERVAEYPPIRRFPGYTATARLTERKLSMVTQVNGAVGSRTTYQVGASAMQRTVEKQLELYDKVDSWLLRPFVQGAYSITEALRAELGMAYSYYRYNGSTVLEPRASLEWSMRGGRSLSLSAGQRGQLPQVQLFALGPEGSLLNNRQIGFTVSQDLVLAYHHPIQPHLLFHAEAFLQHCENVPVGEYAVFGPDAYAEVSMVNAWDDQYIWQLSDRGTSLGRGVELGVEHRFHRDFFYQVNGTLLEATYTDKTGATHDSRWSIGAMGNIVAGREFVKQKEELKRTWGVSGRVNMTGGQRYTPYVNNVPDHEQPYAAQHNTFFRMDLRVYLKRERKGHTGMWSLDLQNLTNAQNEAYKYYDQRQGEVVTKYQLGLIPNLSYRIEF